MPISAKVIQDSLSRDGFRLTTVQYRAPRCILAEINTHRMFSRSARSSRAVPYSRLRQELLTDPFIPHYWGLNKPGMQAIHELDECGRADAEHSWLKARDDALNHADYLEQIGLHKQVINRLLEPFMWVDGLITATEWANFFALRCHPDAEPHMQLLACAIRDAHRDSTPLRLEQGDWHMPYLAPADYTWADSRFASNDRFEHGLRLISAARCARVSYRPFDQELADPEKDFARGVAMMSAVPLHASPFEHLATPDQRISPMNIEWESKYDHGNFVGWRQLRRMLPNNNVVG